MVVIKWSLEIDWGRPPLSPQNQVRRFHAHCSTCYQHLSLNKATVFVQTTPSLTEEACSKSPQYDNGNDRRFRRGKRESVSGIRWGIKNLLRSRSLDWSASFYLERWTIKKKKGKLSKCLFVARSCFWRNGIRVSSLSIRNGFINCCSGYIVEIN